MKALPTIGLLVSTLLAPSLFAQWASTITTTEVETPTTANVGIQDTATETTVVVPTPPVAMYLVPEFAPLGVSLATVIELDEPNPAALPVPMPPLAINPGTTVTLRPLSAKWTALSNVQWFKNGAPLAYPVSAPIGSLILPAVTSADSGSYRVTFTGDGQATGTVFAHLLVQPGNNTPLVNISTRATISPANPQVVVGFSIPRIIDSEYLSKQLLIRAVGETLQNFDVNNPLVDPILRIFDADGTDVTPIHFFPAVIYEDGTTPESRYYGDVAEAANAVGAFYVPVPSPESPPITEYSDLVTLNPGTYTVVVTSAGGQTGEVLVEVYEVNR